MSTQRQNSFKKFTQRTTKDQKAESTKKSLSEIFNQNVFDKTKMQKYLSKEVYEKLTSSIEEGIPLDRRTADQVAAALKAWALDNGATHFTHWFHPLTDTTAEKHDSFLDINSKGEAFESFDGSKLVQQEPDASSFPSGGIRNTFEARGYTVWNPASPAFIINKTLCIPSLFISYTGESLDFKMPLLKTLNLINEKALKVLKIFDKNIKRVFVTVGLEQEYFLIDEAFYYGRPDMMLTGRTLLGHSSAKDQQMQDHYFGAIPKRVEAFMEEFENEAYKLGIPLKTRHNEVAPNQFECANIFEEANLSVDHNMLLVELMRRTARKHNLRVLLHEKPFEGINGSAKHTNWSLMTDTGINLLKPGKNPRTNLMFLSFFVNILKAIYDYADLLRASIISAGNEHRLGGHEAPPSIVSSFIGEKLAKILQELENNVPANELMSPTQKTEIKLGIGKIPEILLDNTDRNRTSPVAFTGNRFEFRAVGSSQNPASMLIVVNTAVANQLDFFFNDVKNIIKKGVKKDEAILKVLKKYISECKNIIFNGNGYSNEWIALAAQRGLTNIKDVQKALEFYISEKSISLFTKNKIFTEKEIKARYEVRLDKYKKTLQIESRILGDIVQNHIIPAVIKYQNILMENVLKQKKLFEQDEYMDINKQSIELIKYISKTIKEIQELNDLMRRARKHANNVEDIVESTRMYIDNVKPYLSAIRQKVDKLERVIDDQLWPLPKYREMLYSL